MIYKFIYRADTLILKYSIGSIATDIVSNDTGFAATVLFKSGERETYYIYNAEAKDIRYENI